VSCERSDGSVEKVVGYLVECHSWGGHSGAPVAWVTDAIRLVEADAPDYIKTPTGKVIVQVPGQKEGALLGLVSAHFDIERLAKTQGDIQGSVRTGVNAGIAVVTPAEAIRELLMREDVVADRNERATKGEHRKPSATFDSAMASGEEYERFEDLARKLVNTPKPKPDEKRKKGS
jgi:hypothetical protein